MYEGQSCISKFIDFVETYRPYANKRIVCIAHNARSYDLQFLVKELLKRRRKIEPILGGQKILSIRYAQRITFIDSLSFLPFSLNKMTKAFNLDEDKFGSKGYSPYLFNTEKNWLYQGSIPDVKYFDLSRFTVSEKSKFMDWHSNLLQNNYVYNQRDELIKYCMQDVRLLQAACSIFTRDVLQLTNVNPFVQSMTLAQLVLIIFRRNYMLENSLGIIPTNRYESKQNQSKIGIAWLLYIKKYVNKNILFETRLQPSGLQVDGFCPITRTVYEMQGCYFHHCKFCDSKNKWPKRFSSVVQENKSNSYEVTEYKIKRLLKMKYKVVEENECKFKQFLKRYPNISEKLFNSPELIYDRLEPRDAVFGGRVEVFRLLFESNENQSMQVLDVVSEYPYVLMTKIFCVGSPIKIYRGDDCPKEIENIHGLFQGIILPPQDLLIPLLPIRIRKKLFFTLCYTCASNLQINQCQHNERERALYGTWPMIEIHEALKCNYRILKTIEIWQYNTQQHCPEKGVEGVFTEYMRTFLRLKVENSGYAADITTEEERDRYVSEFVRDNNIPLDKAKIQDNASYRLLAKLFVNSLCMFVSNFV